jgi:hypothetical protein
MHSRTRLTIMLAVSMILGWGALAQADKEDIHESFVRQALEDMPTTPPTGCVGATMSISSLLPTISAFAFSEPAPEFNRVYDAMDATIQATEEQPRRLLGTVLLSLARANFVQGRDTTAVRQLVQVHDQVLDLDRELASLLPLLEKEGDLEVYPEQGCMLMIGVRTVYICARDWNKVRNSLEAAGYLSQDERERLEGMGRDLATLAPTYKAAMAKVDARMGD